MGSINHIYSPNKWEIVGENEDTYQMMIGSSDDDLSFGYLYIFISKENYNNILNGKYSYKTFPYSEEKIVIYDKYMNKIPLLNNTQYYNNQLKDIESIKKEEEASFMFNKLKEHIGLNVKVIAWCYGTKTEDVGILKKVNDFSCVLLENIGCCFLGYGAAIETILSNDGEILYHNPNLESGYDKTNPNDIFEAANKMFGYNKALEIEKSIFGEILSKKDAKQKILDQNKK